MAQELKVRGICNTCIYRSDCLSLKNSLKVGNPIFHCEQFDHSEFINERDYRFGSKTLVTVQSFSMRNLIPGWGT